jgi:ABC-type branched-subunit amino acid transport system ATPase component/ABC-type branched-subunit amino acid transport system permease subunit
MGMKLNEDQRRLLTSLMVLAAAVGVIVLVSYAVLNKPVTWGVVAQGLIQGSLFGLYAMALVLVYRSSRVINFSQVEIGGVAGSVAVVLFLGNHLNFWVASVCGLASAVVIGVLIDRIVVWRFQNAPRLILTVATLGVLQLLSAVEVELPNYYPTGSLSGKAFSVPWNVTGKLSGFTFTGSEFALAIAVPVVALTLWLLMTRTDVGAAIRACADSSERALLLGIPVRLLSLLSWVAAAFLSGVAGIFSQAINGYSPGTPIGVAGLVAPLAAAAVARFESLPIALVASLVLGFFNETIFYAYQSSTRALIGFFVVLFLALAFQRGAVTRVFERGLGGFSNIQEVRPMHPALRRLPQVRMATWVLYVVLALLVLGFPALHISYNSPAHLNDFTAVAIYAVIAVSLVVLTGWAGQLSFGQFAFVAAGASATAVALTSWHLNVVWALLFSVLVGAILAVIVGLPALRLPGLNLAVITLAFAALVDQYVITGGNFPTLAPQSISFGPLFGRFDLTNNRTLYYVAVAVVVLVVLAARNLQATRAGRVIRAVRDNERAAASYGASPLRAKLLAFAFSGAAAGIAGGLYALSLRGIPQAGFDPTESVNVFAMVTVGGMGSLFGAILGAGIFEYLYVALPSAVLRYFDTGLLLLVVLYLLPRGLGGTIFQVRDWLLSKLFSQQLAMAGVDSSQRATGAVPGPASDAATKLAALEDLELAGKQAAAGPSVPIDPAAAMLALESVDASIGGAQILYGVSFDVMPGEILAMLGTNGAGKSTTLRVIAGLIHPRRGKIYFRGEEISASGPVERVKKGIVLVPGGRGVFSSLTVKENLRIAAWTTRRDTKFFTERMRDVFELFPALQKRLNVRAGLLSGGEQQMLNIAQGLLCNPKLLLIDELSLGLAPAVVGELVAAVQEMVRRGLTVVIVEQSVNVATAVAKRAVFMERGQVRFSGPTPSLEQQPNLLRAVFIRAASRASQRAMSEHERMRAATRAELVAFGVANVTKSFGNVMALRDVSLSVQRGEILGIIGANGAGKTTLFDVCSGFLTPDRGRVVMEGVDITPLPPHQRAIRGLGRVFQDAQLFPTMTVSEVLAVALERQVEVRDPFASMLGLSEVRASEQKIARRVDELLELMGLGRWRNSFVSELSTGTRRILDIACVMAHNPRVLLLDEPSSGIAQRESEAMAELIAGLREETGATFLVIEHDVPLVSYISDRLICMHLGEVIAEGAVRDVLNDERVINAYLGREEAFVRRSSLPTAS